MSLASALPALGREQPGKSGVSLPSPCLADQLFYQSEVPGPLPRPLSACRAWGWLPGPRGQRPEPRAQLCPRLCAASLRLVTTQPG